MTRPQVSLAPKVVLAWKPKEVAPGPSLGGESLMDGELWGGAVQARGCEGAKSLQGPELVKL